MEGKRLGQNDGHDVTGPVEGEVLGRDVGILLGPIVGYD